MGSGSEWASQQWLASGQCFWPLSGNKNWIWFQLGDVGNSRRLPNLATQTQGTRCDVLSGQNWRPPKLGKLIPTDCFLFLIFVGCSPRYWISGLYRVGIFSRLLSWGRVRSSNNSAFKMYSGHRKLRRLAMFCCLSNSLLGDGRSPGNDLRTAFQFLRVATSPFPFQRKRQRSGTNTFTNRSSLTSGALQEGLYFFDIMS